MSEHFFARPRPRRALRRAAVAAFVALAPAAAAAHGFTTLIVGPEGDPAALQAAVDGFRLATRERDGHPNETSDGHLGGLDVTIAADPGGTVGAGAAADVVVATGGAGRETAADAAPDAVVLGPGRLPPEAVWTGAEPGGADFSARFRAAYGRAPDRAAAEGYNAARRIDAALRPLGTLEDREALAAALAETEAGLAW